VFAVSNPSAWSSWHSRTDAAELAGRTGLTLTTVPIAGMVDAFQAEVEVDGLAEENLQARVRAVIWMALSNQHGHLVLACGNKSELATGYSTIYGDAVGGYAPIKDIPRRSSGTWPAGATPWPSSAASPADSRRDHRQTAQRRAAPGPARQRLPARLRTA
jgi:NAD+ synthetase